MRFGINSFLVSSAFTDKDLHLIDLFKAWGADFIELAVYDPRDIDVVGLRAALSNAGMGGGPVCGMFPPDRDLRGDVQQQKNTLDNVTRLIDMAAEIGSKVVAGPFYSSVGRCNLHDAGERARQHELVAGHIHALCRHAEQAGITLAIEPLNRFETDFINNLGQARAMIEAVGSPALKIHADTFHMHIEEDCSARAVREAGNLIGHVHASASHRGIPGRDQADWNGIFASLKKIGYAGDIAIETFSMDNETIARAASIWVQRFDSPEQLAREGLTFLRSAWEKAESGGKA